MAVAESVAVDIRTGLPRIKRENSDRDRENDQHVQAEGDKGILAYYRHDSCPNGSRGSIGRNHVVRTICRCSLKGDAANVLDLGCGNCKIWEGLALQPIGPNGLRKKPNWAAHPPKPQPAAAAAS